MSRTKRHVLTRRAALVAPRQTKAPSAWPRIGACKSFAVGHILKPSVNPGKGSRQSH